MGGCACMLVHLVSSHAPGSEGARGIQWSRWLEALLGSRALGDMKAPVPVEGPLSGSPSGPLAWSSGQCPFCCAHL